MDQSTSNAATNSLPKLIASLPPPPVESDTATEAFRVGDIKQSAADFYNTLAGLLREVKTLDDANNRALLDVAKLRVKSEQEEMHELEQQLLGQATQLHQPQGQLPAVPSSNGTLLPTTTTTTAMDVNNETHPNNGNNNNKKNGVVDGHASQQADEDAAGPSHPPLPLNNDKDSNEIEQDLILDLPPAPYSRAYYDWESKHRSALQQTYNQLAAEVHQRREERRKEASELLCTLREPPVPAPGLTTQDFRNRYLKRIEEVMTMPVDGKQKVDANECVMHIAIHMPHAPAHMSEEWLVLGSQPLTALRDALYCLTDTNVKAVQDQENMQRAATGAPLIQLAKPSAFFYFEGVFYNDARDAAAVDYSIPIRAYLNEHQIRAPRHPAPPTILSSSRQQQQQQQQGRRAGLGPSRNSNNTMVTGYSTTRMEDTTFADLWLRLGPGAPGLYCHQGSCEHLVVVKDVRMYAPGADPPSVEDYPFKLLSNFALFQYRQCEACTSRVAKRVTYNDQQAPHTPYLWCEECYKLMHYNEEGKVLDTNYQVFPYTHDYYQSVLAMPGKPTVASRGGGRRHAAQQQQPSSDTVALQTIENGETQTEQIAE